MIRCLFLIVMTFTIQAQAAAIDPHCAQNLNRITALAIPGYENPYFFTVNAKGEVRSQSSGELVSYAVNNPEYKVLTSKGEFEGDLPSTVNLKYDKSTLLQIEGIKGTKKGQQKNYTLSFSPDCQIKRLVRNKKAIIYDATLCERMKKVGINKIAQCSSALTDLSEVIENYQKEIRSEGYTYVSFELAEARAHVMPDILGAYANCEYINKWKTQIAKQKRPSNPINKAIN